MSKLPQAISNDLEHLAEHARVLMAATADVAGEKVGEARKRLAAALERAGDLAGDVGDRAAAGAKAADKVVRDHPYPAIAVGIGLGALVGFLVARQTSRR